MLRATHATVDCDALKWNIGLIRGRIKKDTKFMAVVKANAYGHGMLDVARYLETERLTDAFAVAIPEEGCLLRDHGIRLPILILGPTYEGSMDDIISHNLTPTIFTNDMLLALEERAKRYMSVQDFHIKIDTGMNRIGYTDMEAFNEALALLPACPHLHFAGMFTHFAVSELPDKSFTYLQAERFMSYVERAHKAGYRPLLHAANSGAALDIPKVQFDMVRGGIAMYGYHPAGRPDPLIPLHPAMSFSTCITHIKEVPAGQGVSYGLKYVTNRPTRVATLSVGYCDGYMRALSGKAEVIVHGKRVPEIGCVCMDQCMCDVTNVPEARTGDEVVLIGRQGDAVITADEVAGWAGTISYEVLLTISQRVPRVYKL